MELGEDRKVSPVLDQPTLAGRDDI
jgi:hypothetical protein